MTVNPVLSSFYEKIAWIFPATALVAALNCAFMLYGAAFTHNMNAAVGAGAASVIGVVGTRSKYRVMTGTLALVLWVTLSLFLHRTALTGGL